MFAQKNTPSFLWPVEPQAEGGKVLVISPAQELYSDSVLTQINQEFMGPIVAAMNASGKFPYPVEYGGCYTAIRKRDIKGQVGKSLESLEEDLSQQDCPIVAIILMPFAFAPDCVFTGFFKNCPVPLIQFDTAFNRSAPWEEFTLPRLNTEQGGHAGPTLHNAANKAERNIPVIAGYWGDEEVLSELAGAIRAEIEASLFTGTIYDLVTKVLPGSRCGCLGGTMNNVGCTTVDRGWVAAQLGVVVEDIPTRLYYQILQGTSAAAAAEIVARWQERYDWTRVGNDEAKIAAIGYQARELLALQTLMEDHGLSAVTTNFESLDELLQLPSLAIQDGSIPWGPEGEALGAILELMLFTLTRSVPGSWVTVAEPYRFCYETGINTLLHMTEVRTQCAGAGKRPKLDASVMPIGGRTGLTARAIHWAEPGRALLVNVAHQRNHPALVVEEIDIVEPPVVNDLQEMAAIACTHPAGFQRSLRQWYDSRANHHPRAVKGLSVAVVRRLAAALGWDFIVVE